MASRGRKKQVLRKEVDRGGKKAGPKRRGETVPFIQICCIFSKHLLLFPNIRYLYSHKLLAVQELIEKKKDVCAERLSKPQFSSFSSCHFVDVLEDFSHVSKYSKNAFLSVHKRVKNLQANGQNGDLKMMKSGGFYSNMLRFIQICCIFCESGANVAFFPNRTISPTSVTFFRTSPHIPEISCTSVAPLSPVFPQCQKSCTFL